MGLSDQEIISSDPAGQDGEGPADGGANPLGRDGGADGERATKARPTAAPTRTLRTAAPSVAVPGR